MVMTDFTIRVLRWKTNDGKEYKLLKNPETREFLLLTKNEDESIEDFPLNRMAAAQIARDNGGWWWNLLNYRKHFS